MLFSRGLSRETIVLVAIIATSVFADSQLALDPMDQLVFSGNKELVGRCAEPPLSCPNVDTTPEGLVWPPSLYRDHAATIDRCCTNTPGGYFVQTQFWDTYPPVGPNNSWTIHGLWPDHCDGRTFDVTCDPERVYRNISDIMRAHGAHETLEFMSEYWLPNRGSGETFWQHEWNKHGTCVSTLETKCFGADYKPQQEVVHYLEKCVELFKNLPTFQWLADAGIVPSKTETYTLAQLQEVAKKNFGHEAIWMCDRGELREVWWGYTTKGSVVDGVFIPSPRADIHLSCPETNIRYLPKREGKYPRPPTPRPPHDPAPPLPEPTGPVPAKVYLRIQYEKSGYGCIIGDGTWYASGTCAGFRLSDVGSGRYILRSNKGPCEFAPEEQGGEFSCRGNFRGTIISFDEDGYMTYGSSKRFYASALPTKWKKSHITSNEGPVEIKIRWGTSSRPRFE